MSIPSTNRRRTKNLHNNGGQPPVRRKTRSEAVVRLDPASTTDLINQLDWLKGAQLTPKDTAELEVLHCTHGEPLYWETMLAQ